MKRLLIVIMVILIVITAGLFFWPKKTQSPVIPAESTPPAPTTRNYSDNSYGFRFEYPPEFQLVQGPNESHNVGDFLVATATPIVTVRWPDGSFPGTNFYDGFMTVSVSTPVLTEGQCQLGQYEGSTSTFPLVDKKMINGLTFYHGQARDAAAGTFAQSDIYHVWSNSKCLEFTLNLFQGNIGNYEPGTITQIDEKKVSDTLDWIVSSVTFIKPANSTSGPAN